MNKGSIKKFDSEKYGMEVCPDCNGTGYVQNPTRQCCPKCRGFGYIKKEKEGEGGLLDNSPHRMIWRKDNSEQKQTGRFWSLADSTHFELRRDFENRVEIY